MERKKIRAAFWLHFAVERMHIYDTPTGWNRQVDFEWWHNVTRVIVIVNIAIISPYDELIILPNSRLDDDDGRRRR